MNNDLIKNSKDYNRRLITLIVAVFGVVAIICAGLFLLNPKDTGDSVDSIVEVTESEKLSAENVAEEFIKSAGNFGVITNAIDGDSILDVSYLLIDEYSKSSDYLLSRADSYIATKDQYIHSSSPLQYDTREVTSWLNPFEIDRLATIEAKVSEADSHENGKYLNINEVNVKAIEVDVTFDSKETVRDMTANDSTWDGSYSILEKEHPNTTATITVALDSDEEWRIYSVRNLDKEFLLSTWKNPSTDYDLNREDGFKNIGKLERTKPLEEPKVNE